MLLNFDYDGVIADSLELLLDLACRAQTKFSSARQPTKDDYARIENLTFEDIAIRIGLSESEALDYKAEVLGLMQQANSFPPLYPEIGDVLLTLSKHHTVTIISSSLSEWVGSALTHNGIDSAVSAIFGGDLGVDKATRIKLAQNKFGFSAQDTYMFGDAISDIRQGKLARVNTGAVTWGFQDRGLLLAEQPDLILDTPGDLLKLISV